MKALPILKDLLHAVFKASLNLLTMSSMTSVVAIRKDMYLSRAIVSSSRLDPHICPAISCVRDASNFLRFSSLAIYFILWKLFPVC